MYWRYTFVFMYVCLCTISYILMYILLNVYLSVSGYILFVSARIPVHICKHHSQYMHVFLSVSARRQCTYPCLYLHVSLFVSASIPVHICMYPTQYLNVYIRTELHVSRLYLNVLPVHICLCPVCVCIFSLMHILQIIDPAGQPNYNTHRHIHNHSRTHIHCAVFFLRLCISVGALSVQRLQQPVLE